MNKNLIKKELDMKPNQRDPIPGKKYYVSDEGEERVNGYRDTKDHVRIFVRKDNDGYVFADPHDTMIKISWKYWLPVDEKEWNMTELKRGDRVWVSDESEEAAREDKAERIFLANVGGQYPFITITSSDNHLFLGGEYCNSSWRYAIPVEEEKVIEVTMEELEAKYGCKVKIKKLLLKSQDSESWDFFCTFSIFFLYYMCKEIKSMYNDILASIDLEIAKAKARRIEILALLAKCDEIEAPLDSEE